MMVIHELQIEMLSRFGKLTSNTDKISKFFIKRTCPEVLLLHTMQDFTCLTGVAIFISPVTDEIFTLLSRYLCLHFLKRIIHVTLKHYPRCPEYYQLEKRCITEILFQNGVISLHSLFISENFRHERNNFPLCLWIFDCRSYRALSGVLFI